MVYENATPTQAISKSVEVLKKTWGESLVRHYGLGMIFALFFFLGIVATIGVSMLLGGINPWIPVGFASLYFVGLILIFNVANSIFNTALYVYASQNTAPSGFGEDVLQQAFRLKKAK